jgi:hypothetical protein
VRVRRFAVALVALASFLLAAAGSATPFYWGPGGGHGFAPTAATASA